MAGLTNKQRKFIEEYLVCWNATEAARRAGYSEKTARSIGAENLTKPDISSEIQAWLDERAMSAGEVLDRLAQQARLNLGKYLMLDNSINTAAMIADGLGHLIKGVKRTKYGDEIEFHDAFTALQLLGKHHRLFAERQEITGKDGGAIEINDSGGVTDEQRVERLIALANRVRARTN